MCIFFEGTDFEQVVPSDAACVWAFLFRYRSNDCSYTFPRSYVREMRDIFQFARKTFKKMVCTFCIQHPTPHIQASLSEVLAIVCR